MPATKDHCLKVFLELPRMHKGKQERFDNGIIYAFSFPMWAWKNLSSNELTREWVMDLMINAVLALWQSPKCQRNMCNKTILWIFIFHKKWVSSVGFVVVGIFVVLSFFFGCLLFVVGFGLVWLLWVFFGFVLFFSKKLSYAIQGRDQRERNLLFWLCLQQKVLANFLWSQWPCVIWLERD